MGNQQNKKRVNKRKRAAQIKKMIKAMTEAKKMRKAGLVPTFRSGISKIKQENAAENENQELCKKIRDSLKQLRQSDTCKEEPTKSSENNLNPSLSHLKTEIFIEVLPHNSVNQNNTEENAVCNKAIKEEPIEFYDESNTPGTLVEVDMERTPIRRNLQRKAKAMKKDHQHAKPEEIFVSAIKRPSKKVKRPRLETTATAMPMYFDHTEQLYDYGKYLAEQMMGFDEEDICLAQAEINDVVAKYRLKYKIKKCLLKPSAQFVSSVNSNRRNMNKASPVNSNRQKVIKRASQVNANLQNVTRFASQVNENRQSVVKSELSSLSEEISKIDSSSLVTPLGFIIEPLSIPGGFHISTQRIDSTGSIVSQPVTLQGIPKETSETELESSEVISNNSKSMAQPNSPNKSTTHSMALLPNTFGMSITDSGSSSDFPDRISVTEPSSHDTVIFDKILVPTPGSSHDTIVFENTLVTDPGSPHDTIISEKKLVNELGSSNGTIISEKILLPEPGSSHNTIVSEKTVVTEPESAHGTIVPQKTLVTEPGSSHDTTKMKSVTDPASPHDTIRSEKKLVTELGSPHGTIISEKILLPEPGSSHNTILSEKTLVTEPGSSHDTIISEKILVTEPGSSHDMTKMKSVTDPTSPHYTIKSEKKLVTELGASI